MQKRIISLAVPLVVGIMALALGWFAHAAAPLSAQGIALDGQAAFSSPAVPASTAARLAYQGRLSNNSGAPINTSVNVVFKLYDQANALLWTSATRSITPTNGLFTVYLGEAPDPILDLPGLPTAPASVGVTVGGDPEMAPHQPLNTVVGHGVGTGPGVFGSSVEYIGAVGATIQPGGSRTRKARLRTWRG